MIVNSLRPLAPEGEYTVVTLDATSLALEVLGKPITNIPMLGALVAVADLVKLDSVLQAIDEQMQPAVREKNKELLQRAYQSVLQKTRNLNGGG